MLENRMLIDEEWDTHFPDDDDIDIDYAYECCRDEYLLEELGEE